jgi:hypothetical protein
VGNQLINRRLFRQCIQKLERVDRKNIDHDYIMKVMQDLTLGFTSKIPSVHPNNVFYRAIKRDKPSFIAGLSYPPSDSVNLYGRGNYKKQSVFYCSLNISSCMAELCPTIGDNFVISRWKSSNPFKLNHIGYTDEVQEFLQSDRQLHIAFDFIKDTRGYSEINSDVYDYLSQLFNEPVSSDDAEVNYKLSSVLCNHLIASPDFDGLIYPSVRDLGTGDNVLFKKDFVDSHLRLIDVIFCEVIDIKEGRNILRIYDYGIPCDSHLSIMWQGPNKREEFLNYIDPNFK